uniref:uncharacterized protein LOC109959476 n=1 Tax=Monopterus albus TaxID=43700 RepID=UPI0009B3B214|nr:uncharacterized protein LOC109959476 [Monopterus albus]
MGRRMADLTTPVPVLGVPALVGVCGWKTTEGDKSGVTLLQKWGLQCSVGIQTSPGISRPSTQDSVKHSDTLAILSDSITQTSNSSITKETEYKKISLLTKSDKEKMAILKQKSEESKTKKEITFRELGSETSKDEAGSKRNATRTYCYARAIKTNSHFAGNATNVRPKLKPTARYTNGSVVDSEATGGICIDNDEVEHIKNASFGGRQQTRLQDHYAEQSGKMLLLSSARLFDTPQTIYSHCGGKQSATGAAALGKKSPTAHTCPLKSALTSPSTTTHFQLPHKPPQHQIPENNTNRDNRMHITVNPQIYLNKELKYRKAPHLECPVHSKGNRVTLSHAHATGDATSTQPTTILHAKTITVTEATIETRQADATLKSFVKQVQENKSPQPMSLILTPQMTTATKPNNPHPHTNPKLPKTSQHNSSQYNVPPNVCVSVQATPENTLSPPSHLYITTAGPGKTSNTNTHKTATNLNATLMSAESIATNVNAQNETLHSVCRARVNIATTRTDSPLMTVKCSTLSKSVNALDHIHASETTAQPTPARQPCMSPDLAHKTKENLSSGVEVNPTAFSTVANIPQVSTLFHIYM